MALQTDEWKAQQTAIQKELSLERWVDLTERWVVQREKWVLQMALQKARWAPLTVFQLAFVMVRLAGLMALLKVH